MFVDAGRRCRELMGFMLMGSGGCCVSMQSGTDMRYSIRRMKTSHDSFLSGRAIVCVVNIRVLKRFNGSLYQFYGSHTSTPLIFHQSS